jgi:DNA-binding LacI/PurR family transcriptional regulator/DNA-binding transcriptional regulator YhcF (GntR family)
MPRTDEDDSNSFLYEKIYLELKKEILSGAFVKGDWFPSERTLKERFATTHLTVRNALAKLVQEGYIERFSGKGTIVIFAGKSKPAARLSIRFSRAQLLIAEPDATGVAFVLSLEEQLRRIGLPLSVGLHHGDPTLEKSLLASALESRALAILFPAEAAVTSQESETGPPDAILVGTRLGTLNRAQVVIDVARGARETVRRLIELGHSSIGLLAQPGAEADSLREGWEMELGASGLETDLQSTCANGLNPAAQAARAMFSRHPGCSAILCGSDLIAAGAWRASSDFHPPASGTPLVVGYGNTPLAEALDLPSIDPQSGCLGELVMATIVDYIRRGILPADPRVVVPTFVERGLSKV